jgi:hypothetical protein
MQKGGGSYRAWYVGISKDARERLFNGHRVRENWDPWIYIPATSSQAARDVEDYLVNNLGTDGGLGGGDHTADVVYAYKKAAHTKQ